MNWFMILEIIVCVEWLVIGLYFVKSWIKRMNRMDDEIEQMRNECWTSVKDRYPDRNTLCLVFCNRWGENVYRIAAYYVESNRFIEIDKGDITDRVVYWMEIPGCRNG